MVSSFAKFVAQECMDLIIFLMKGYRNKYITKTEIKEICDIIAGTAICMINEEETKS